LRAGGSRRGRYLLVSTTAAIVAVAWWVSFDRSLIPASISGEVVSVEYVDNTGFRLWTLDLGTNSRMVDDRVGSAVQPGDSLSKDAFATTLAVNGSALHLAPSPESWRIAVLGIATVVAVAVLTRLRECETGP
jgi:hypothetical protein